MFFRSPRPRSPRRGVTLVEMLVTVALLVLMMTVIVQIFQAATGAVSAARTYQDLDSGLRQLDATIRQDLGNVTARMTPPLDPKNNLGYFEYIENSFADLQGEDTDDCLRFTVKAPEGQIFTGRFYPNLGLSSLPQDPSKFVDPTLSTSPTTVYEIIKNTVPITIQSQYAEIIYFLRNGNLYRRVLLVAPERQSSITQFNPSNSTNPANYVGGVFSPAAPALQTMVSWQGLNDLSAHPSPSNSANTIVLNTLGDLTNRENRYGGPRFCNDFASINLPGPPPWTAGGDGRADDFNSDSVNDFYPSLYYNVALASDNIAAGSAPPYASQLIQEVKPAGVTRRTSAKGGFATFATMAFPYVYPYAYSQPDPSNAFGWIHSPDPNAPVNTNGGKVTVIQSLSALNHSPLEIGDSLPTPSGSQTWFAFPTWRETMSPNWLDPWVYPGTPQSPPFTAGGPGTPVGPQQAPGLNPFDQTTLATAANGAEMLPPVTLDPVGTVLKLTGATSSYRTSPQLYNDGTGSDTFAVYTATGGKAPDFLWKQCWEDDLILTGVRSFDVKAYDNSYPGYVDLGWGDDGRLWLPYLPFPAAKPTVTAANWLPPFLSTNSSLAAGVIPTFPLPFNWPPATGAFFSLIGQTYAHEGRIPPLTTDFRLDSQATNEQSGAANAGYNVGDDSASVVRLRRTFDTWSTDYSYAPATAVDPTSGQPYGLGINGGRPVYPSYPAPYPMPLRGLQIQIRVVDPRNERVKVLTIRQDFSDKL